MRASIQAAAIIFTFSIVKDFSGRLSINELNCYFILIVKDFPSFL